MTFPEKNCNTCGQKCAIKYHGCSNWIPMQQEIILFDKIRAEIDVARFIDKDTKLCKNANASGLEVAMQIIDKYKAESEG